jgi:hypothetical protein
MSPVAETEQRVRALERQLQWHRRIGVVALIIGLGLALAFFLSPLQKAHFTEVDVERLNVIEPDGQLVFAVANTGRLPDPIHEGKPLVTDRTGPGMIFFDGQGQEVGGLIYGTRVTEDGYAAGAHLSLDQFRSDQVVYLDYQDNGTNLKAAGLYVVDRDRSNPPRFPSAQRIFIGSANETAMVRLRDRAGKDRILLSVSPEGVASLEFLDSKGAVVDRIPK